MYLTLFLFGKGKVKPRDGKLIGDIIIFDVLVNRDDVQVSNIETKSWNTAVKSNMRRYGVWEWYLIREAQ